MYSQTGSGDTTNLNGDTVGCVSGVQDDAYAVYFVRPMCGFTGTFDFSNYLEVPEQISGCMDSTAQNYNPEAVITAGNEFDCLYHLTGEDNNSVTITTEVVTDSSNQGCEYETTVQVITDSNIYSNADITLTLLQQVTFADGSPAEWQPALQVSDLEACLEGVGSTEENNAAITSTFFYDPTPGESVFEFSNDINGNINYITGQSEPALNPSLLVEGTTYTNTFVIEYTETYSSLVNNSDFPNYTPQIIQSAPFTIDAVVYGCTDSGAYNYDPLTTCDDGSCEAVVTGCLDETAYNFNEDANTEAPCYDIVSGCTDSDAVNYQWNTFDHPNELFDGAAWASSSPNPYTYSSDCQTDSCINSPDNETYCVYCDNLNIRIINTALEASGSTDFSSANVVIDIDGDVMSDVTNQLDQNTQIVLNVEYKNGGITGTGSQTYSLIELFSEDITLPVYQPLNHVFDEENAGLNETAGTLHNLSATILYNNGPNGNARCKYVYDEDISDSTFNPLSLGCTDPNAFNYDSSANYDDGNECEAVVFGCTDAQADNNSFTPGANTDDGSCQYNGCTDSVANNTTTGANTDDGSCQYWGCTYQWGLNYGPEYTHDDGSCFAHACTDVNAYNTHYCFLSGDPHGCFANDHQTVSGVPSTYGPDDIVNANTLCHYEGCMDAGVNWTAPAIDLDSEFNDYMTSLNLDTEYASTNLNIPYDYQATMLGEPNGPTGTPYTSSNPGQVANGTISYDPEATIHSGNCQWLGCTNPNADNYDPQANQDDDSCITNGCVDDGTIDVSQYIGLTNIGAVADATSNNSESVDLLSSVYKWLEKDANNPGWESDVTINSTSGSLSVSLGGAVPTNILHTFIGPANETYSILSPDSVFEYGSLTYSKKYSLHVTAEITEGSENGNHIQFALYQFNTDILSAQGITNLETATEVIKKTYSSTGDLNIPEISILNEDESNLGVPLTDTCFKLVLLGLQENQTVTISNIELKEILNSSPLIDINDLNSTNIDTYASINNNIISDPDFAYALSLVPSNQGINPHGLVPSDVAWKRSWDKTHISGVYILQEYLDMTIRPGGGLDDLCDHRSVIYQNVDWTEDSIYKIRFTARVTDPDNGHVADLIVSDYIDPNIVNDNVYADVSANSADNPFSGFAVDGYSETTPYNSLQNVTINHDWDVYTLYFKATSNSNALLFANADTKAEQYNSGEITTLHDSRLFIKI